MIQAMYRKGKIFPLLFFLLPIYSCFAQEVSMTFTTSHLDYLSVNYGQTIYKGGSVYGGLRFHFNTNPEKNIFTFYYRDFHSFNFQQTIGFGLGYSHFQKINDFFQIGVGLSADLFHLGLKGYKASPALPVNGRPQMNLDYLSFSNPIFVIPLDLKLQIRTKLSRRLYLLIYGGIGMLFHQHIHEGDYYPILASPNRQIGSFEFQFTDNYGIGICYEFKSK